MKRSVLILVVAMLLSVANSWAQSGTCGDNLFWVLNGTTLTISGRGAMDDYIYMDKSPWYSYRGSITDVIIGDSVTAIGNYAFLDCGGLTAVTIPDSVTVIGNAAFRGCTGLSAVTLPSGVTAIGERAFIGCSGLTAVTIPSGVTTIGYVAFLGCNSLTAIDVDERNENYSSENGVLFNKSKTILIQYPAGKTGATYPVPDGVTTIMDGAFWSCIGLTAVTLPSGVTTIGIEAFAGCTGLTAITLPSGVTTIGNLAFYNCTGLTAVIIPSGVTTIGEDAFNSCTGITAVTIPSSVTTIGKAAFIGCTGLKEVTVAWTTPLDVPDITFVYVNTSVAILHVPPGTKAFYQTAPVWGDFGTIEEYDPDGNENIHTPTLTAFASNGILYISGLQPGKPIHIYNLAGQFVYKGIAKAEMEAVPVAARGIYIVAAEAQTVKVIMGVY